MKVLTVDDIRELVLIIGFNAFFERLVAALQYDFSRWRAFRKSPRHATHYAQGVIELMPCADERFYAFKYVNGHPGNPAQGKLSVVAIGQLSDAVTGYPLLLSEMTLLTAFRTAATAVLASKYLAREDASSLALIGTGAQAEFQALGFNSVFPLRAIRYFDSDAAAMDKFSRHMSAHAFDLIRCANPRETVRGSDIVVTATAAKKRQILFELQDIAPGTHIHAMGGDCPGKTELSRELLERAKVVVEFIPQSVEEGEVQQCGASAIYAELWEIIAHCKPGRENAAEITVFDSVGFALEDFAVLRMVYELAIEYQIGRELDLLPEPRDPKDLFGVLSA